jgi:hypothetical protein
MARKARIYALGALHHVIIRGVERKRNPIVKDSQDYGQFLQRPGNLLTETDVPVGCP